MKIRYKITILLLLLSVIPIFFTSYIYYLKSREAIIGQVLSQIEAISQTQKHRLIGINESNIERIKSITNRYELKLNLLQYTRTKDKKYQDKINEILNDARPPLTSYKRVSILDMQGNIVGSTDSEEIGNNDSSEFYFLNGRNEINLKQFLLADNRLYMHLSGPLMIDNKTIGVAAILTDANSIVAAINDYTGLGETGETVLSHTNDNGDAVFITNVRKDPQAALRRIIPKSLNTPSVLANSGVEVLLTDKADYMGDPVFASTRYIKETEWGLVSKIDRTEALAKLDTLKSFTIMLSIISALAIVLIGLFISARITRPLSRLQHAANEIIHRRQVDNVQVNSNDETGTLARAFNQMTENLLQANSQLEQTNRDLHKHSETITESEKRFRAMTELQPQLVWTATPDGKLDYVNRRTLEYTGANADRVMGDGWLDFVHPDETDSVRKTWKESIASGNRYEIEFRFRSFSGEYRWFMARAIPVKDRSNNIEAWFGITTDVHSQKEILETRDEFTAIVTHELRTPLTGLKGYIQLIKKCMETPEECDIQKYLGKAENIANKLNRLVSELHEVSKVSSGGLQIHPEMINLNEVLDQTIDAVQNAHPGHKIIKDKIESVKVFADRHRIEQVITNYLTNAIKYSPSADKVLVRLEKENREAILTVKDFGIGIPASKQNEIFQRFYRASNAKSMEGLGLGLYLSKAIVEAHGGRTWFRSKEGEGSTFYFTLPLEDSLSDSTA